MPTPSLHHVAFACGDLEDTHHFYEDLLGFPLVHTEVETGRSGAMKHVFYDLGDGSCIAFFHLQGAWKPQPLRTAISTDLGLPVWVNHVALRAEADEVDEIRRRLQGDGIPTEMEIDHDWCQSTYVVDPNGILIEFTVDTPGFEPDPAAADRLRREPVGTESS